MPHIDFNACYDEEVGQKVVDFVASLKLTNEVAYVAVAAALAGNLASCDDPVVREGILNETQAFMREYINIARSLGGQYLARTPQH